MMALDNNSDPDPSSSRPPDLTSSSSDSITSSTPTPSTSLSLYNNKPSARTTTTTTHHQQQQTGSIKIFVRVRPPRPNSKLKATPGRYWTHNPQTAPNPSTVDPTDPEDQPRIGFHIPKEESAGLINNQKETYDYRFHRVFDRETTQEEVFDYVARDVILR
jgi:hypothetical protein